MKQEYLELIELTELFLLDELKRKQGFIKASSTPPAEPTPPSEKPLSEPILETKVPIEVPKTPIVHKIAPKEPSKIIQHDLSQTLDLLKTHHPGLNLQKNPPRPLETVGVLIGQESDEEKALLRKMKEALIKEGYQVEEIEASSAKPDNLSFILICRKTLVEETALHIHIRRDEKKRLFFGIAPVFVIKEIEKLIEEPLLRKNLWQELLKALRS